MAELRKWPMALNQPGYEYPAELFRAEHHDATSGGNGVGAPTALKVTAQQAPDGTVSILPGGATVKSTYAGADGQSYHVRNFQSFTLEVPPTGSSAGGRTDLVILRVCDPQYDDHPEHGGGEITAGEAANYDFWWFELLQGQNRNTSLSYPHVKLAELVRPANTTVVTGSHIRDLRVLAAPKTHLHMRSANLNVADQEWAIDQITVWPDKATHTMHIPEFATRMHVAATWGTVRAPQAGSDGVAPSGTVQVRFTHPDGDTLFTQASNWNANGDQMERLTIVLGDIRVLPAKWRGVDVVVDMLGRARSPGPNVWMDGGSSFVLQMYFEQSVA